MSRLGPEYHLQALERSSFSIKVKDTLVYLRGDLLGDLTRPSTKERPGVVKMVSGTVVCLVIGSSTWRHPT